MSKRCPYRWFLVKPRIAEKLSDCLVFCCNILTGRYLAAWRLSANCLDGLLMKGIVKCEGSSEVRNCQMKGMSALSNSDCRNGMSWLNPEIRNMSITTLTYWADA